MHKTHFLGKPSKLGVQVFGGPQPLPLGHFIEDTFSQRAMDLMRCEGVAGGYISDSCP